jgi:hypothetical protein
MSDYDRQRDIDAEGQRAAIYHADKRAQPGSLPSHRGRERHLGIGPEGRPVDNVTEGNRYTVYEKEPWITVNLFSEDRTVFLEQVFMPNTRERPDVLEYEGRIYEVITTKTAPAQYRLVMSLQAVKHPPTGETT